MASPRAKAYGIVGVVAVSTPVALLLETVLRQWMFPPEFDEVRAWLEPTVTPWVWLTPIASALAIPLGHALQRWLARRNFGQLPPHRRNPEGQAAAEMDAMLLATSAPQVPAIVATFGLMVGSRVEPVAAAMAVATVGVLVLGVLAARRLPAGA